MRLAAHEWQALDNRRDIARWDGLAGLVAEPNPFYESWYLLPALRVFATADRVKLLCLEAGGQLLGLLPVHRKRRYYGHRVPHLTNWLHPNAFAGAPLVAKGYEHTFWHELFAWADRHARESAFLHLSQLPAEGPLHHAFNEVVAASKRPATLVAGERRAMLCSALSPDAYLLESVGGKKRKELRRQQRRLSDEGELSVERSEAPDGLPEWIEDFLKLEQTGWKGARGSALASDTRTASLFREGLVGAAQRNRLQRLALRLDGRPIAMLATFLCPPGAFSFKTTFDESLARFSPGVLLQLENLRMLERPAIAWTDSCAAADHPMIDHIWRERRILERHNVAIGGSARRLLFRVLAARETRSLRKAIQ